MSATTTSICRSDTYPYPRTSGLEWDKVKGTMSIQHCKTPLASLVAFMAFSLASSAAGAETRQLFKCVDAKGVTSIQSSKCAPGSTEAWRRQAPAEPTPTAEQTAQAEAKLVRDRQAVRELSEIVEKKMQPAPPVTPRPAASRAIELAEETPRTPEQLSADSCQAAQAFALAVREKTWLGMTDDQTRRLYGWVSDQCKVRAEIDD